MKFNLTISDMTKEELTLVSVKLGLGPVTPVAEQPPVETPDVILTKNEDPIAELEVTSPAVEVEPATQDLPVVPAGTELDANGLPWDARIHASTKTKVKAGTWKYKPKLDDQLKAQVEAELRAATNASTLPAEATPVSEAPKTFGAFPQVEEPMAGPDQNQIPVQNQIPAAIQTADPAVLTPAAAAAAESAAVAVQQQPTIQPAPELPVEQAAPVPTTQQQAAPHGMPDVMSKIQQLSAAGKLSPTFAADIVAELSTAFGVSLSNLTEIANNQPMIDYTISKLNSLG